MNERILVELRQYSNSVFNDLNIELSEILQESFEETLSSSVKRMEEDRRTSESDIKEAKLAFTRFINEMYRFREERFDQKDLVRYTAINESKSSICPLWPIC